MKSLTGTHDLASLYAEDAIHLSMIPIITVDYSFTSAWTKFDS